jgi:hypothetical protein
MRKYYFENVDDLVNYLLYKEPDITPLRLQISLYFLFAFYIGTYQNQNDYPKYLFNADFEAWYYGPTIRRVYLNQEEGKYIPHEFIFGNHEIDQEVNRFINDLLSRITDRSDFSLIDRLHEDTTWRKAMNNSKFSIMSKEDIASEYKRLFKN